MYWYKIYMYIWGFIYIPKLFRLQVEKHHYFQNTYNTLHVNHKKNNNSFSPTAYSKCTHEKEYLFVDCFSKFSGKILIGYI